MISLYNEYNETGDYQAFISAKECENNKDNFLKILKEELMDENKELTADESFYPQAIQALSWKGKLYAIYSEAICRPS